MGQGWCISRKLIITFYEYSFKLCSYESFILIYKFQWDWHVTSKISTEETISEQIIKYTTIFKNEMFQVNIPLKYAIENLKLGELSSLCKMRFLSLEKKLHKNPHTRYILYELKK